MIIGQYRETQLMLDMKCIAITSIQCLTLRTYKKQQMYVEFYSRPRLMFNLEIPTIHRDKKKQDSTYKNAWNADVCSVGIEKTLKYIF